MSTSSPSQPLQDAQFSTKEDSDREEQQKDENVQNEEGVIEVVKRTEKKVDDNLEQLNRIEKTEPLVKIKEKKFSLENIMALKSNTKYELNKQIKDESFSDLLTEILFDLQGHVKQQMVTVDTEQRGLLQRIKYVDELSLSVLKSMVFSLNQKKLVLEKIPEGLKHVQDKTYSFTMSLVTAIKELGKRIHQQTAQVFKALSSIEKALDPEDRITNQERWSCLNELYQDCTKKTSPSVDRLIKSNSSEPFTTLESVSTAGSLSEELAVSDKQDERTDDDTSNDTQAIGSSSTPSLALSRLRGLSSMSIRKES